LMVSLLSEFRATLPFLQLRSGERDQNIINEVGAALLPRSGLVQWHITELKAASDECPLFVFNRLFRIKYLMSRYRSFELS
uniref:hypothetical protein n=1 Tax=Marisediminitalea sp. TaxID=2662268 RepID=UPI003514EF78